MEEKLLQEQQKTNKLLEQLLKQNKDPNELLTVEQVKEETGIGINMVRKMFKDPELQVQIYTVPFRVTRQAFNNYISQRHDYLSER